MNKYNLGNIKIRILDEKHSECVQKKLFEMGCCWVCDFEQKVQYTDTKFLFVDTDGKITWSDTEEYFNRDTEYWEFIFDKNEIGYKKALQPSSTGTPMLDVKPVSEKPPLGIRPRYIVARERAYEILEAMHRYVEAGQKIPKEWIQELGEVNISQG